MSGPAKKRKMNFSELEVEIIVGELERQKHVLISHYNAGVPLLAKTNAWEEILRRVNAVSPCERESSEVKKKWSDMKTEVRRKVAQVRAALEDEAAATPVILTPMQQRICNLLGEATIISLPSAGECTSGLSGLQEPIEAGTTVTLSQIPAETTYHTLDDGVVEYCTTETPTTITTEAPVEITTHHADASSKPQELKSRIALNSAKLLQEQRVTNLHVKEIAQHLEQQNDLLQSIRRSQEIQASAQERQAQAMEGSQATLGALIQLLRPVIKDFRRFLQSNTPSPGSANDANQGGVHGQKNSLIQ